MEIKKATTDDAERLSALIKAENNQIISAQFLKDWYWHNPFESSSVIMCLKGDDLVGMASTNNFKIQMSEREVLVAFPQKVLTSKGIRGQGYFSKLYFENEKDNLETQKVDFFLTFTNAMSTPIFLKKFDYYTGICPDTVVLPTLSFFLIGKRANMKVASGFDQDYLESGAYHQSPNGVKKSRDFLNWRYSIKPNASSYPYIIIEVNRSNEIMGYAVVKKMIKKGIPMLILADLVTHRKEHVADIIRQTAYYGLTRGCLALTLMSNDLVRPALDKIKVKLVKSNALNFLVKGTSKESSESLAMTHFNFTFGDLDFV
ncbi:MAG: GNAT family N-acetyltransferase [Reichenbachiella sp.]|uniref:GNAT family N-acetyltransferase n=1 Tax=Reichenbachiella sp. TaxID=2184521 RepID=UPI0032643F16